MAIYNRVTSECIRNDIITLECNHNKYQKLRAYSLKLNHPLNSNLLNAIINKIKINYDKICNCMTIYNSYKNDEDRNSIEIFISSKYQSNNYR